MKTGVAEEEIKLERASRSTDQEIKEDATSATDDYLLKKKLQIEETKSHQETQEVKKPTQVLRRTLLL